MSTGKDPKTMPVTKEYEDGYKRIFGDKEPTRGRWIWDETKQKLVRPEEYQRPTTRDALHAPVMAGRFYENTKAQDGTDIGSRAKRREYMREKNLADYDDFKGVFAKAEKERDNFRTGGKYDVEGRIDDIKRAFYEHDHKR